MSAPEETTEKGKSDDKCVGNRRMRTILLTILLLTFAIFAAGYEFEMIDTYDCKGSFCEDATSAWNLILSGLVITMIFAAVIIVYFMLPMCDINSIISRILGAGLILGALLYIFGWVYWISTHKDAYYDLQSKSGKEDWDAQYLAWFGEALMFSASCFLLGADLVTTWLMEPEGRRLFLNLLTMAVISVLVMPAYFIIDDDGVEAIATGYIIILITSTIYIILYILSCCKCAWADLCLVRAGLAVLLILGGIVTAAGYYVYAGDNVGSALGSDDDNAKYVAYWVGYTILVGGLCFTWGIDIAWDDVKGNDAKDGCCNTI